MIGESPTRPGIFQARPEVVVTPEISPPALIGEAVDGAGLAVAKFLRDPLIEGDLLFELRPAEEVFCCCSPAVRSGLGPQPSAGLRLSRQASHASRDGSVSRSSF
jgi:hypothetical protein